MAQTKKNVKQNLDTELLKYGYVKGVENSEDVSTLNMSTPSSLMFEVDLVQAHYPAPSLRAWIKWTNYHNCECHKAAALCFFQWTKDGKYEQAPMVDGFPSTNYIMLGQLAEVQKL